MKKLLLLIVSLFLVIGGIWLGWSKSVTVADLGLGLSEYKVVERWGKPTGKLVDQGSGKIRYSYPGGLAIDFADGRVTRIQTMESVPDTTDKIKTGMMVKEAHKIMGKFKWQEMGTDDELHQEITSTYFYFRGRDFSKEYLQVDAPVGDSTEKIIRITHGLQSELNPGFPVDLK